MQIRSLFVALSALGLSQLAAAAPGYDSEQYGVAQSFFDFCTKVDHGDAKKFDEHAERLYRGLKPAQIAQIKNSAEYRKGYAIVQSVLGEVTAAKAKATCNAVRPAPDGRHEPENR